MILRICAEVLKKEDIALDDNFFGIGGNSLNAVRVVSRIQKELDIDFPLKEMFFSPSLAEIAGTVRAMVSTKNTRELREGDAPPVVPISDDELNLLSQLQVDDEE
jgi:acyl carrier protein